MKNKNLLLVLLASVGAVILLIAASQPRIVGTEVMKADGGKGTNTYNAGVLTNQSGANNGLEFALNSRIYHDESDDALVLSNIFHNSSIRLTTGLFVPVPAVFTAGSNFFQGDLTIEGTINNGEVGGGTNVVNNYYTNFFYTEVIFNGRVSISTNLFVNFGFFTNLLGFLDASGTFTGWRGGTPSIARTQTVGTVQFASADDVQLDWTMGDVYEGTNGAGHDVSLNLTNLVRGATLSVDILGSQTERAISVTAPSGVTILWGTDTNGSFAFTARTNGITSASFTVINPTNVIASAKPFGPW